MPPEPRNPVGAYTFGARKRLMAPRQISRSVLSQPCPLLYKAIENPENRCHITPPPPNNGHLSYNGHFHLSPSPGGGGPGPRGGRYREFSLHSQLSAN